MSFEPGDDDLVGGLNFDALSQFDSAVDWQFKEFCWSLGMAAHRGIDMFMPACHAWFVCAHENFSSQEEATLLLFDEKIVHCATLYNLADCRRFHEAEVSDDPEKALGAILYLDAGESRNVRNSIGKNCQNDVALVKDSIVLEVMQKGHWRASWLSCKEHCGSRHTRNN